MTRSASLRRVRQKSWNGVRGRDPGDYEYGDGSRGDSQQRRSGEFSSREIDRLQQESLQPRQVHPDRPAGGRSHRRDRYGEFQQTLPVPERREHAGHPRQQARRRHLLRRVHADLRPSLFALHREKDEGSRHERSERRLSQGRLAAVGATALQGRTQAAAPEIFHGRLSQLTASKTSGMEHMALRARSPQALERRVAALKGSGFEIGWTDGDMGQGPAFCAPPTFFSRTASTSRPFRTSTPSSRPSSSTSTSPAATASKSPTPAPVSFSPRTGSRSCGPRKSARRARRGG